MKRRLLAKVMCPCCWNKFTPTETLFLATHPEERGDELLGPDEPRRFLPTRFTPAGEAIDPRGFPSTRLACPRCHLPFPSDILERMPLILSLAGMPASGKTFFLASAMWQLRQVLPRDFRISFQDADAFINRPLAANEERLFLSDTPDRAVALDKTELEGGDAFAVQLTAGVTSFLPRPYIFTLRPRDGHLNGASRERLTYHFCLYDNAGEHYLPGADTPAAPGTRHLSEARVLMFMFDPLQDARFRAKLRGVSRDPQLDLPIRGMRQDTLLTELTNRVRAAGGATTGTRIKRPIFLLIAKSDAWAPLVPDIDLATEPHIPAGDAGRVGLLDRDRITMVSTRLRELLGEIAPEIVAAVEDGFERVIYLPVSSTGGAPSMDPDTGLLKVCPSSLHPHWVTVPFTYALARYSTHLVGFTKPESGTTDDRFEVVEDSSHGA
ncbi:MAG: hypothetical protein O2819_00220 [Planctomycetota bacterium]|nr:hypothetical protein [Planctomycetota bacterium]MDA1105371.1 hypothetical protein [Planctomycetota bacterium]